MAARERQRDKQQGVVTRRLSWPTAVLAGGILLSLAANLARAQPTAWGRIVAAVPPAAFLVAVSMIERRAARRPRPAAGQDGSVGEPSAPVGPRRAGQRPTRCAREGSTARRAQWRGRRLDRHREGVATYRDGFLGHGPAGSRPAPLSRPAAGPPAVTRRASGPVPGTGAQDGQ
jgi:hypothetical protein